MCLGREEVISRAGSPGNLLIEDRLEVGVRGNFASGNEALDDIQPLFCDGSPLDPKMVEASTHALKMFSQTDTMVAMEANDFIGAVGKLIAPIFNGYGGLTAWDVIPVEIDDILHGTAMQ